MKYNNMPHGRILFFYYVPHLEKLGKAPEAPEAPNFLVDKGDCLLVFMTPQQESRF